MNAMTEFKFHTHAVRVFPTEDGLSFMAVAADVAEALEYEQTVHMLRCIDEEDKGFTIVDTLGGPQRMLAITESGMYAATFRSRKPSARAFRRWVTSEVLPSIRRTGSYVHAAGNMALAQEVGALRDDFRQLQGQFVAVLHSHVKTSERCVRLQRQVGNLKERLNVRARIDSAVAMLAAGLPRLQIQEALGISNNYLRQIAKRARDSGRLSADEAEQADLFE